MKEIIMTSYVNELIENKNYQEIISMPGGLTDALL